MATTVRTLQNFIGGDWVEATGDSAREIVSPVTGEKLADAPNASADDVDRAARAAREAQPGWAALSAWDRAKVCHAIADLIEERKEDFARELSRVASVDGRDDHGVRSCVRDGRHRGHDEDLGSPRDGLLVRPRCRCRDAHRHLRDDGRAELHQSRRRAGAHPRRRLARLQAAGIDRRGLRRARGAQFGIAHRLFSP